METVARFDGLMAKIARNAVESVAEPAAKMLARLPIGAATAHLCAAATPGFLPAEGLARMAGTRNPLPKLAPIWNVAPSRRGAASQRVTQRCTMIAIER